MEIAQAIKELEGKEKNIRFDRAITIATAIFGKPVIRGSHYYFKMPWAGEPIVCIVRPHKGGLVKAPYIRKLIEALKRKENEG
jgi:hypothetical protein